MPLQDDLGKRMKSYYEEIPKTKLMRRTPVAIRVDGKAFHTFTRGFHKPFDEVLTCAMQETMRYLCQNIQGCVLGYTQSDEITLLLVDYQSLDASAWFDYEVQKMCSIAASMATLAFAKAFQKEATRCISAAEDTSDYQRTLQAAMEKGAMFDARVFNIPKEEAANLLYWRQLDAIRNSILTFGQAHFSHKQMQGKSCTQIRELLLTEKGIDWEQLPLHLQRGSCCVKETYSEAGVQRKRWLVDLHIPIFKGEGRDYINARLLLPPEQSGAEE
ncbi:MAG: tRNA(His) guanylyltransferase Thg1 family protein [Faecousia sp.]